MKIAILHEMLVKLGGAEKVVERFCKIFPEAPVFTLIYDEKKVKKVFKKEKISPQVFKLKTQKIYSLTKKQRFCLPFMAKSVEALDFSEYDVVLCSSSAFAHGAITKPETKFIVYYHSPARYMWDWTNEYKRDLGLNLGFKKYFLAPFINSMLHKNRIWDFVASKRVDISLANSANTKKRIEKYYKKDAEILFPPVEIERFGKTLSLTSQKQSSPLDSQKQTSPLAPLLQGEGNSKKLSKKQKNNDLKINPKKELCSSKNYELRTKNYYIVISELTEFKKIDIAINAFNNLKENLVIIGDGAYREELKKLVKGENIVFVGKKFDNELVSLVQNSLGLIFPGEEDFGIVPIEAMAAGKPVFAYNSGGLTETVLASKTGEFFDDKNGTDFIEKFKIFHKNNIKGKYKAKDCKDRAKKFDAKVFEERIRELVSY